VSIAIGSNDDVQMFIETFRYPKYNSVCVCVCVCVWKLTDQTVLQ